MAMAGQQDFRKLDVAVPPRSGPPALAGGAETPDGADIFLSYKRADREAVEPLARQLEAQGWNVWWDPVITPGESYSVAIRAALEQAKCVIVVWSHGSIDSHWVLDEASHGRDRGMLVPVVIDGVSPPLGFRQVQAIDLSGWSGRPDDPRMHQLFAGVRRVLCEPAPPPASPGLAWRRTPVKRISTARAAVLGAIGVLALLPGNKIGQYVFARAYEYPSGRFMKDQANIWKEHHQDRLYATFEEFERTREYIILVDKSRSKPIREGEVADFYVQIPICGGQTQWTYSNPIEWQPLHIVRPVGALLDFACLW
jgi:hypothetical protein